MADSDFTTAAFRDAVSRMVMPYGVDRASWLAGIRAGWDAALARPAGDAGAMRAIRDYAVKAAATCREAERERAVDLANRAENHAILHMLREQHYSWGEKAKSYDALVAFIDALPITPATAVEALRAEYDGLLRESARMARRLEYCGSIRTVIAAAREAYERAVHDDEVRLCLAAEAAAKGGARG